MELTKEQHLQIDNYIFACGIKFYDVRTEIVDHFANILEQKLNKNPDLNFKKEIENIHRNFSDRGFSRLLKEKTKSVQKRFFKQSLKNFITFFKVPKIIIAAALFYCLHLLMQLFDDKELYFYVLTGIGFLYLIAFLIKRKEKKNKFLALNLNNALFHIINNMITLFNTLTIFRNKESFTNPLYNNIQLTIYVMLILLLWSVNTVYNQNKKTVRTLYPLVTL